MYDVSDTSGPGIGVSASTIVEVLPVDDGDGETPWGDYAIAIGLILLVAAIGALAGHLTGYRRIGSGGADEEEPGEEGPADEGSKPTAEEIVSELETTVGEPDDGEYLDHEPTVAELEAMIPRPPRE